MPHQDGPFVILECFSEISEYVFDLPSSIRIYNYFHSSLLTPHHENDDGLFLSCQLEMSGPIVMENRQEEHFIDKILGERRHGCGVQYLVRWRSYSPNYNEWKSRREMEDTVVLDKWEKKKEILRRVWKFLGKGKCKHEAYNMFSFNLINRGRGELKTGEGKSSWRLERSMNLNFMNFIKNHILGGE